MPPLTPELLQRPDIWRLRDRQPPASVGAPTGYAALDRALHGHGWPRGALTELLPERPGSGELRLLLPALAECSRQGLWQLWIDPPFTPYGPALLQNGVALDHLVIVRPADRQQWLWACAQALRAPGSGAVLCWPGRQPLRYADLRKLQVAAAERQCCGFVVRDDRTAAQASPSSLRLQLRADSLGTTIDILKQRGAMAGQRIVLPLEARLQEQVPLRDCPYVVSTDAAPRARVAMPLPAAVREVVWQ